MSSGKGIADLSRAVADVSLGSGEDGAWEEVSRKQKNKGGRGAGRPWNQQNPPPKAWGQPDTAKRLGIGGSSAPGSAWNTPTNGVAQEGSWALKPHQAASESKYGLGSSGQGRNLAHGPGSFQASEEEIVDDKQDKASVEDEEDVYTDDDDDMLSDDYDSDESPSHEMKRQHRMLKKFFEELDKLKLEEVNEPEREWHCPACQGGSGAIDWYKGLQPLTTHARTKGSQRVKLHRMFADLLDEELRRKGTSVVPAGESFGQWEGLKQEKDFEIVWPPMVVIMNTTLEKDENDKWLGMGNHELMDYFSGYAAVRAKHSYGPRGHRGLSVLIFDGSATGYMEAERLHKHFLGERTGRTAWESKGRVLFYPGGKRQLYGFMARKEDLEEFNKHCPGKTRLKYEMRSHMEKVVTQLKQMNEDNQQLTWYKSKAAKEQGRAKALEESFNVVSEKYRKTMEENRIVRQRTKMQHEQNREEMDFQEQFFKDQIQQIHDATVAKEDNFEKLQQEERKKVEESGPVSKMDDLKYRAEEVSKFKLFQEQEMKKFVLEREELMGAHENSKMEMKRRHWEEELQLEKDFDVALTKLMEKYAPRPAEGATGGDGGNNNKA